MKTIDFVRRPLAAILAGTLLWTEGASPLAAASRADDFWAGRRRAIQGRTLGPVAALPVSLPLGQVTRALDLEPVPASVPLARDPGLPIWTAGWPLSAVHVDEIHSHGRPDIIFIKDLHAQLEAQKNVAAFLNGLARDGRPVVVGVEGASGPLDFRPFRAFGNKRLAEQLADAYLSWDWIQAPEYAGLTGPENLRFVGAEDRALYRGNIDAYRRADKARDGAIAALNKIDAGLESVKDRVFTPAQRRMDKASRRHRSGAADTSAFLEALRAEAPGLLRSGRFPQTDVFLQARAMESSLDFGRVERDRELFLLRLTQALSPEDLRTLADEVVRFRSGDRGTGAFHAALLARGRRAGINTDAFPALSAYVRYALSADGIDRAALFAELETIEDSAWKDLSPTPAQTSLRAISQDQVLTDKLVRQALSDEEWSRCASRRGDLMRLPQRARAVGAEAPTVDLTPFEDFYRYALARNDALAGRFLKAAAGAPTAVLVAGGFHTRGVTDEFRRRGLNYVVLSPRIEKVDGTKNALDALTRGPTPLDRLLMGESLFVAKPVSMGPADGSNAAVAGWSLLQIAEAAAANPAHPEDASSRIAAVAAEEPVFPLVSIKAGTPSPVPGGVVVPVEARAKGRDVSLDVSFGGTSNGEGKTVLPPAGEELKLSVGEGDPVPVVVRAKPTRADRARKAASLILPFAVDAAVFVPLLLHGMNPWTAALKLAVAHGGYAVFAFLNERGHLFRGGQFGLGARIRTAANLRGNLPWRAWLAMLVPFVPPLWGTPRVATGTRGKVWTSISRWGWVYGAVATAPLVAVLARVLPAPFHIFIWGGAFAAALISMPGDLLLKGVNEGVHACGIGAASEDMPEIPHGMTDASSTAVALKTALEGGAGTQSSPDAKDAAAAGEMNAKAYSEIAARAVAHHMATVIYALQRSSERGAQQAGCFVKMLAPADKQGNRKPVYLMIKVNPPDRRDMVIDVLEQEIYKQIQAALKKGYAFPPDYMETIGHTRYGTNTAAPKVINAQPFIGAPPYEASSWITDEEGKLVEIVEWRAHTANHNGDQNKMHLYEAGRLEGAPRAGHHQTLVVSNGEMRAIEKKATGYATPSAGDSPMITREMDFLYETEGTLAESLRAALLMTGFASFEMEGVPIQDENGHRLLSMEQILERVTTPAEAAPLAKIFERFFKEHAQDMAAGTTLEGVYRNSGGASMDEFPSMQDQVAVDPGSPLAKLSEKLESSLQQTFAHLPWVKKLSPDDRRKALSLLVGWSLRYFVINGPFMAGVHLLRNSDPTSTYGVSLSGLHNNGDFVWGCLNQPVYIWVSEDGKFVGAASESNALKGARGKLEDLPFRYTMKDGEVAHYDRKAKTITVYNIFSRKKFVIDVKNMAKEAKGKVVVDMRNNRYVTTPVTVHPKNRARNDLRRVVDLLKRLAKSFSEKPGPKDDLNDPRFWNYRTSEALSDLLVKKIGRRLASGGEANYVDVLLFGTAQDRDVAENMAEEWRRLTGQILRIEVMDAASYSGNLEEYPLNKDTVVLAVDHFGLGANAVFAGKFLQEMKARGKCGEIFLMAGGVDNPFSEKVLGQEIHDDSDFLCRNIVTMPRMSEWYPAEARSLTNIAPQRAVLALTRHVFARVGEAFPDFRPSHEYEGKFSDVIPEMDKMIARYDELTESIVGFDADGNPLKSRAEVEKNAISRDKNGNPVDRDGHFLKNNALHDRITKTTAKRLSQHVLETKDAVIITALHLSFTFITGQTLPGMVFKGIFRLTGFALFDTARFAVGSLHFGLFLGAALAVFFFVRSLVRIHNENKDREVPMKRGLLLNALILTASLSVGLCFGQLLSFPMAWMTTGLSHLIAAGGLPSSLLAVARAGLWLLNPHAIPLGFTLDFSVPALVNVPFYMVFGWIVSVFILRVTQKRDPWARLGSRTITFADVKAHVGDRAARYLRRVRGLNYAIADFAAIYASTIGKVVWDLSGASNARGGIYVIGVPRSETHSEAAQMATKHLRAVQNGRTVEFTLFGKTFSWDFKTGPEMIGIGFDPQGGAPFQDYILLDDGKKGGDLSYPSSPFLRNLNEGLCEANLRLVAQQVLSEETGQLVASATEIRRVGATQNTTLDGTTQQPYGPIPAEKAEVLAWPMLESVQRAAEALREKLLQPWSEAPVSAPPAQTPAAAATAQNGDGMNGTSRLAVQDAVKEPIAIQPGSVPVAPVVNRTTREISVYKDATYFRIWNDDDSNERLKTGGEVTSQLAADVKTFFSRMGLPEDAILRASSWKNDYSRRSREGIHPPSITVPLSVFNTIIEGRPEDAALEALDGMIPTPAPVKGAPAVSGEILVPPARPAAAEQTPPAPSVIVDPSLMDIPVPTPGPYMRPAFSEAATRVLDEQLSRTPGPEAKAQWLEIALTERGELRFHQLRAVGGGFESREVKDGRFLPVLGRLEGLVGKMAQGGAEVLRISLDPSATSKGLTLFQGTPEKARYISGKVFQEYLQGQVTENQALSLDLMERHPRWLDIRRGDDGALSFHYLSPQGGSFEASPRKWEELRAKTEGFMDFLARTGHGDVRGLRIRLLRDRESGFDDLPETDGRTLAMRLDSYKRLLQDPSSYQEVFNLSSVLDGAAPAAPAPARVEPILLSAPASNGSNGHGTPREEPSAPTNGHAPHPEPRIVDFTLHDGHLMNTLIAPREDSRVGVRTEDLDAFPEGTETAMKSFLRTMSKNMKTPTVRVVFNGNWEAGQRLGIHNGVAIILNEEEFTRLLSADSEEARRDILLSVPFIFRQTVGAHLSVVPLAILLLVTGGVLAGLGMAVAHSGAQIAGHAAVGGWQLAGMAGLELLGIAWMQAERRLSPSSPSAPAPWGTASVARRTLLSYAYDFLRRRARTAPAMEEELDRTARGMGFLHADGKDLSAADGIPPGLREDLSFARANAGPEAARAWAKSLPRVSLLLNRLNPALLSKEDLAAARPLSLPDRIKGRNAELAALLADGNLQGEKGVQRVLDAHRWGRFLGALAGRSAATGGGPLLDLSRPLMDPKRPAVLALHVKEGYFSEMAGLAAAEIIHRRENGSGSLSILLVSDGAAGDLSRVRRHFLEALALWQGPQGVKLTQAEILAAGQSPRFASAPSGTFLRSGADGERLEHGAAREYVGERLQPPAGFALSIVSLDGRRWRVSSSSSADSIRVIELFLPGIGVEITPELWDSWKKAVDRSA